MKEFSLLRRGATLTFVAALATGIAGCNGEYQGNLNGAAPQNPVATANPATPAPVASVTPAAPEADKPQMRVASVAPPANAPIPVPRPDFGTPVQVAAAGKPATGPATAGATDAAKPAAAAQAAASPTGAAPQAPATTVVQASPAQSPAAASQNPSAAPQSAAIVPAVPGQQAPAAAPKPVRVASAESQIKFFGLFSPAPVPAGPKAEEDPEPPLSPSEESLHKRSFNAYEDRVGDEAAGAPKAAITPVSAPAGDAVAPVTTATRTTPAGAVITASAYAPAVVEVNGVSTPAGASSAPRRAIRASLAPVARYSGPVGGGRWRAAYPNVVTHCFDSTLRSSLETIGRHFNAEVEVTSGYRSNGRRRSMHRFCRAADIRVPGVAPSTLARFARSLPGVNGVGTYRRKSIIHIDTRLQQMTWRY